jgi:MATE family multidrug resistance protein
VKFKSFFSKFFTETKVSLALALPLIASEFVYGLSGFISTIMVAHLGREALAANVLVWNIFIALVLFFIGILIAVGVMVAHSHGACDKVGIRQITQQGIILAFILAIPMMLVMLIAPDILIWSGQDPVVIKLATPYFYSLIWSMLTINLTIVFEQFLIGIALTRLVMLISIVAVPLQLFFGYAFTFGAFGIPAMGLVGMGYGIVASNFAIIIPLILYVHFSYKCREYKIFTKFWYFRRKYFNELLRVGLPIGGMYFIEVALFAVVALMMGKFGSTVLAAHQIAYQYWMCALTIVFGLSQGATIRIGHEVGRQNKSAVQYVAYVNMSISFAIMLFISLLYVMLPKWLIGLDINVDAPKYRSLVENATTLLFIAAILQLGDCLRLIGVAALRALKDTKIPMYISVVGFWLIAFPLAYLFGFHWHFGGAGVWWGLAIGLLITMIIVLMRFKRLLQRVDLASLVMLSSSK